MMATEQPIELLPGNDQILLQLLEDAIETNNTSPDSSFRLLNNECSEVPLEPESSQSPRSKDCLVCDRRGAGTSSAFGGRSCHSCRSFFRRTVLANRQASLICNADAEREGACTIDSRSWTSCQKCRFFRCVHLAGMKETLVFKGVQKSKIRRQQSKSQQQPANSPSFEHNEDNKALALTTLHEPASHQGQMVSYNVTPNPQLARLLPDKFTLEDFILLKGLYEYTGEFYRNTEVSLAYENHHMINEFSQVILYGSKCRFSPSTVFMYFTTLEKNVPHCFGRLSDFQQMEPDIRQRVLKINFPVMRELHLSALYSSKVMTNKHYRGLVNDVYNRPADPLRTIMQQLGVTQETPVNALAYDHLHGESSFNTRDGLRRHREKVDELRSHIFKTSAPDHEYDEVLFMLLDFIALFSPKTMTDAALQRIVEPLQKKYAHLLFKYLGEKEASPVDVAHRFATLMKTHEIAKQAHDIRLLA